MRNTRKLTHRVLTLTALALALAVAGWQAPTLMAYSNQMVKAVRAKLDRAPAKAEVKAAVATLAPMQELTKEQKHDRMKVLLADIAARKGQADQQSAVDAALAELKQISDSLGGDLPANEGLPGAPPAPNGVTIGVIPPAGQGCVLTTSVTTQSTPTAIPTGPAVVSSTVTVAGAGPYLWDVNLRTFITHSFAADLDITIQSPAGTVVTLTTDNGAINDNVFNGTVWDDGANPAGQVPYVSNNGVASDHAYVNLTLASPLVPEEAMAAFQGENPNGTWTITISDDLAGDGGSLASWDLEISTLPAAPMTATTSATQSTPTAIPTGPAVVSSTLAVAGAGTSLSKLTLLTNLTHTFSADLDITLMSPAGTVVTLTTDNGAGNDNTFNGTLWDDDANPAGQVPYLTNNGLATDHAYVNLVTATPLVPEEAMGAFIGENPNGTWTITISDDLPGDGGSLDSWTLNVMTATCAQPCTLTCPANVTVSNDANQCGAVVSYPPPTTSGTCGTVTCSPASGSFFPVGLTTVTCSATGAPHPTCSFTVRVNDTQPPAITCPANIFVGTTGNLAVVNYPAPAVSDNCPGVGAPTCSPASGSNFAVGVTVVTCSVADAANNTATCSFAVTVNRVSGAANDPLACTGPGNTVTVTLNISNNGNVNQNVANTTTFTNLVGVSGSCTANIGTCVVTNAGMTYSGTLAPGQTATISYLAQVSDLAPPGAQVCANNSVTFNAGPALNFSSCRTVTCPAVGPGGIFPAGSEMSDQKAGSVLIYNVYTSSTDPTRQNTRINITNVHSVLPAFVHLFFVAEGCAVADSYICLTPNQTASFLASDLDPGVTGYMVAVAVDGVIGCPVNFNYLIGDEYVKFASGHAANLGAEAFAAIPGGRPVCDQNSVTATIAFDGVSYNRTPAVLALDNVGSRADGNDTLLIVNRIGGNLGIGAASLGSLFGILYDDAENALSFSVTGGCQLRSSITNNFPRTTPRFETFIPAGRTGWLRIYNQTGAIGMTGAAINFNPNSASSAGAFNQGHNLHALTLNAGMSYVIPVFPPSC